jgi:hypothetical protein
MDDPKTRLWRSTVPQSEEKLFSSVNHLTLLDRFLMEYGYYAFYKAILYKGERDYAPQR